MDEPSVHNDMLPDPSLSSSDRSSALSVVALSPVVSLSRLRFAFRTCAELLEEDGASDDACVRDEADVFSRCG